MLLCFLFGCSMCKLSEYIYIYFGTTVLYLLPVEWQVCLYYSHKSPALWGPATQTADGDSHSASPHFSHQELHSIIGLRLQGLS